MIEIATKIYQVKKVSRQESKVLPWDLAIALEDFSYPWNPETPPNTEFRALWDDYYLYFQFDVKDENIYTHVINNHKREVDHSDRVEIFFSPDDTLMPYYCLEMDSTGRTMDFKAKYYKDFNFDWQWPLSDNLKVNGKKTASGYIVEGRISLESLKQLGLVNNGEIRAGLYRANCVNRLENESKFKWISWVDPQTKEPDFHVQSSFGRLILMP